MRSNWISITVRHVDVCSAIFRYVVGSVRFIIILFLTNGRELVVHSYDANNPTNLNLSQGNRRHPLKFIEYILRKYFSIDGAPSVRSRILVNSTKGIAILALKNIKLSNAGLYACSVKNSMVDGPKVQNITLDVMVPPTFLKKPTSQSFPNGRTARFECQAQGTPMPKIYWLKDSANITTNGKFIRSILDSSVTFRFTCFIYS